MSDADADDRDLPARVEALDAVIETARSKVGKSSWYRRFGTSDVARNVDGDVSNRTIRRALNDATALGWVEKSRNEWQPAERAKALAAGHGVENTK
jgi:hypothetical protein